MLDSISRGRSAGWVRSSGCRSGLWGWACATDWFQGKGPLGIIPSSRA